MKVNFYATLRDITGGKVVDIPVDQGVTAQQLLDAIIARYPPFVGDICEALTKIGPLFLVAAFDFSRFFCRCI